MEELRKAHEKSYRNIKIEKELLRDMSLTAVEIAVLFRLITKLDSFKPSINRLSKILHISPKSIRTATDSLQRKGYLKIVLTPMKKPNIWLISQTREFKQSNEEESAE